jgi:hypothetical protein
MENKVTKEQLKQMFTGLIQEEIILDIDKEMADLKIPDEEDFLK